MDESSINMTPIVKVALFSCSTFYAYLSVSPRENDRAIKIYEQTVAEHFRLVEIKLVV